MRVLRSWTDFISVLAQDSIAPDTLTLYLFDRFKHETYPNTESANAAFEAYRLINDNGGELVQGQSISYAASVDRLPLFPRTNLSAEKLVHVLARTVSDKDTTQPWASSRHRTAIRLLLHMDMQGLITQHKTAMRSMVSEIDIADAVLELAKAREGKGGAAVPDWRDILSVVLRLLEVHRVSSCPLSFSDSPFADPGSTYRSSTSI